MRRAILGAAVAAALAPGLALADNVAGSYEGPGLTARIGPARQGEHPVSLSAGVRGCGGRVDGVAVLRGTTLVFRGRDPALNPAPLCVVSMQLRGRALRVREEEGCTAYHGAACEFTGDLRRR